MAFLENNQMKETQEYLSRGRRFQSMDLDTLNNAWAALFRAFADGDRRRTSEMDDMGAEMRLRGCGYPGELVKDALDDIARRLGSEDVAKLEGLRDELDSFMAEAEQRQKN